MDPTDNLFIQGDHAKHVPTSRQTVLDRLAERHAQTKAAQIDRRNAKLQDLNARNDNKALNFLPEFLQKKASILADLEDAVRRSQQDQIPICDLTKILDDSWTKIESMQKWLNDTALYLTAFDTEQARMELKQLNNQFQSKREELLPTKKFTFSRKPKPATTAPQPTTNPSPRKKTSATTDQPKPLSNPTYDERFSYTSLTGPQILTLPKPESNVSDLSNQTVYLADLTDCTIHIESVCANLIGRRLVRCKVYAHPVAGSVWLEDCSLCDLVFACRQLRVHQTRECRLALHMASRPIIENCTHLQVAPYQLDYPNLESDFVQAGLSSQTNLWREVEDFSCPNKRLTTGSPNWSILPESEWKTLVC